MLTDNYKKELNWVLDNIDMFHRAFKTTDTNQILYTILKNDHPKLDDEMLKNIIKNIR